MNNEANRGVFLAVVWEKARMFEEKIRADIVSKFRVLDETECFWPRREFTKKLAEFYGWNDWFCWWNKARKCGRGAFRVIVFEVAEPHYAKRKNAYGRETLVETGVYDAKRSWRHLTKHSNRVHASLNTEETEMEARALFGESLEDWLRRRTEWRIPSTAQLEALFAEGGLTRLGIGSRRTCHQIPGTELCVKGYRSEEEVALGKHPDGRPFKPLADSVKCEIRQHRMSDMGNTSCQEWRYYNVLKTMLPSESVSVFPELLERVLLPSRGWCLVENVVKNADGSPVRKFHEEFHRTKDAGARSLMRRRLKELEDDLARYAVRFYDPQNVMVQWMPDGDFRFRIIDFEPASRMLVPLDDWFPTLVRMKVRRRFARYRKMWKLG